VGVSVTDIFLRNRKGFWMRVSVLVKTGSKCARVVGLIVLLTAVSTISGAAGNEKRTTPEGVRLLANKSFDDSEAARGEILQLYKNLRVTDVLDGMDAIGLQDMGLMANNIRPLWRDAEKFTHRTVGFAITVRYVPTDVRVGQGSFANLKEYQKFEGEEYRRSQFEKWTEVIKPGDIVVIDARGVVEGGHTGSNNSLGWAAKGLKGVITNGGVRDTDEIVKVKKIAVYCRDGYSARGIVPGRLLCESYNFPIVCGGALVFPGDVIVADGDGVIVVPREHALEVGRIARDIHVGDEKSRAGRFKVLGMEPDETVIVEKTE